MRSPTKPPSVNMYKEFDLSKSVSPDLPDWSKKGAGLKIKGSPLKETTHSQYGSPPHIEDLTLDLQTLD
jgi:hypothetical protein